MKIRAVLLAITAVFLGSNASAGRLADKVTVVAPSFSQVVDASFVQPVRANPVLYRLLESGLRAAIEEDPYLSQTAPDKALELARVYLADGRPMEAVWALESGGLFAKAELVARKIENRFKISDFQVREKIKGTAYLGTLLNGHEILIKQHLDEVAADAEVLAYQTDRALGINLVPVAAKRVLNGEVYTLHSLIAGATETGLFLQNVFHPSYPDIWFLDYLIGNWDRNSANSMFALGGKFFANDHSLGFGALAGILGENGYRLPAMGLPSRSVGNYISTANPNEFAEAISFAASPRAVTFVTQRVIKLQNSLSRTDALIPRRPVRAQMRLQLPPRIGAIEANLGSARCRDSHVP